MSQTVEPEEQNYRPSLPPATTREEDRHTASQRSINRWWEVTQSILAVSIVVSAEVVCILIIMYIDELASSAFTFVATTVGTVIGFYFGRTNHQRVGGVDLGR